MLRRDPCNSKLKLKIECPWTLLRDTGGEKIIGIDLLHGRRKVKNLMRRRVVTHEREDAVDIVTIISIAAAALVAVLLLVL